ncbi:hypothetical protein SPLC1_S533520 [Arthrospira platensis C1]|nr:hypothetical protein SPLC1_S533520 [Arthrospira platensis C1]
MSRQSHRKQLVSLITLHQKQKHPKVYLSNWHPGTMHIFAILSTPASGA